jgi:polar amino acid transport system substrate-binding protein
MDSPAAARDALKAGTVDLVFGDGVQLAFWLQSEPAAQCCAFVGGPYVEPRFFGPGLAIALPPDRKDLRLALNWALDSLYDKGVFTDLYLRYFPVGYF